MHGTDVVFLGVSVDEAKDKQKWLDFIETEGLKGIQLLANGWSKITKDYKINGIPRFYLKIKGCPAFTLFSSPLSRQYLSFPTYFQKLKSVQKKLYRHSFLFCINNPLQKIYRQALFIRSRPSSKTQRGHPIFIRRNPLPSSPNSRPSFSPTFPIFTNRSPQASCDKPVPRKSSHNKNEPSGFNTLICGSSLSK